MTSFSLRFWNMTSQCDFDPMTRLKGVVEPPCSGDGHEVGVLVLVTKVSVLCSVIARQGCHRVFLVDGNSKAALLFCVHEISKQCVCS